MRQFSVDMFGRWPVDSHTRTAVYYRYDGASARPGEGSEVNTALDPRKQTETNIQSNLYKSATFGSVQTGCYTQVAFLSKVQLESKSGFTQLTMLTTDLKPLAIRRPSMCRVISCLITLIY